MQPSGDLAFLTAGERYSSQYCGYKTLLYWWNKRNSAGESGEGTNVKVA